MLSPRGKMVPWTNYVYPQILLENANFKHIVLNSSDREGKYECVCGEGGLLQDGKQIIGIFQVEQLTAVKYGNI